MNPERVFTILVAPHSSEKVSNLGESANQYSFKVAKDATKPQIREAVETLFGVTVIGVTTLNVKPKHKRNMRGQMARKKGFKKAYVRLEAGQDLDHAPTD